MLALGYPKYVTQGGDWGSLITRGLALVHPEACRANHVNLAFPQAPSYNQPILALQFLLQAGVTGFSKDEKEGFERSKDFQKEGMGYYSLQSTKPQTIGYSQADSPVGLLAWIYEKLHDWTDAYPWTDDEVLTWVSVYAFSTAGPAAASRIYYEVSHNTELSGKVRGWIGGPKLGVARFREELVLMPKLWNKTMGNLVFESEYEKGGHFAAWERPDAIVSDLRTMFGRGGGAFGVVEGTDGYDKSARL